MTIPPVELTTEAIALEDTFDGDNEKLINSIRSLIALNDKGALTPHGIGGLARSLLSSAAVRLSRNLTGLGGGPDTGPGTDSAAELRSAGHVTAVLEWLEYRGLKPTDLTDPGSITDQLSWWEQAMSSTPSPAGWQDISTAPRDGRPVVGWVIGKQYGDEWPDIICYNDIFEVWCSGPTAVTASHWKAVDLSTPSERVSEPAPPSPFVTSEPIVFPEKPNE